MILSERPNDDDSQDGFTKWPFMTTHTFAFHVQIFLIRAHDGNGIQYA